MGTDKLSHDGYAYNLCRYFEENYIGLRNLNGERNAPFILKLISVISLCEKVTNVRNCE